MFFPLFERHAELIEGAALVLQEMLNNGIDVGERCRAIGELESQADAVTREVQLGVRASFITPIDRTDIRHLISGMDDTIDQMNRPAQNRTMSIDPASTASTSGERPRRCSNPNRTAAIAHRPAWNQNKQTMTTSITRSRRAGKVR